jgi:peptide/nickel transport system permease protein
MTRVVLVRLAWMLPILLGVSVVAFVLMRALPGDFAQASAGTSELTPAALDTIRRKLGLDRPVWEQYLRWLGTILRGDFGNSFVTHKPVLGELFPRLAVTAELTLMAGTMAMLMGATSGLLSARLRGRTDWLVRSLNGLFLAVPNFVVATLIVLLAGLLLPAFSLSLAVSVTISENTRAAVLEVSSQDFVMVARAKGLHARTILVQYLVRNALTPVITVTGLQLAALLGGSILIETIFTVPGMGQYLFDSISNRDYPVIQAIVLVAATIVLLMNVLVDIAYARVDARVRYD